MKEFIRKLNRSLWKGEGVCQEAGQESLRRVKVKWSSSGKLGRSLQKGEGEVEFVRKAGQESTDG